MALNALDTLGELENQGNQIQMMFGTMSDVLELTRAGTLLLLCVTADNRIPAVADVPTTRELGLTDLTPQIWYGYVAPSSTPATKMKSSRRLT